MSFADHAKKAMVYTLEVYATNLLHVCIVQIEFSCSYQRLSHLDSKHYSPQVSRTWFHRVTYDQAVRVWL